MSRQPFDPSELADADGRPPDPELSAIARELEAFATAEAPLARPGLSERVMATIAAEPPPTPPHTFLLALGAFHLGDAWRALGASLGLVVAPGRAVTVGLRLQAVALLLVVALLAVGGGTVAAVGAAAFVQALTGPSAPAPTVTLPPSQPPSVVPPSPSGPSHEPGESAEPSETSQPSDSAEPGETPEPSHAEDPESSGEDHGGSGRGSGAGRTPRPSETPEASGDHGGDA